MSVLSRIFGLFQFQKQISTIDQKISRLAVRKATSEQCAADSLDRLQVLETSIQKELAKTRLALSNSQKINRELEEALGALRDELKTATEITIPGLVAANRVFIDRWEAESKIHVMRSAIMDAPKDA